MHLVQLPNVFLGLLLKLNDELLDLDLVLLELPLHLKLLGARVLGIHLILLAELPALLQLRLQGFSVTPVLMH